MILLVHESATHGMVATPDHVRGVPTPSRKYHHEGHFLAIDGDDEQVVKHDAEDILKIPGFRLATAAEQNEYHAGKRKVHQIVEDVPAETEEKKPRSQRRKE